MWYRDKLVWSGALLGAVATAYALFIGRYLPYIDWSNHLAIISVLAHGQESGALDYMTRSWAPTPYFLFYGLCALFAQVLTVDVAAKLVLVLASLGYTFGAAAWAQSMGRSPRQGLIAPLAFFGVSMGYGFASFVFATPFLFFSLAAAEDFFQQKGTKKQLLKLSLWLCGAYLAHALMFLLIALLLIFRTIIDVLVYRRGRTFLAMAAAALPSVLLALPATITHITKPWQEAGSASNTESKFAYFVSWAEHRNGFGGHLLERGSVEHILVMKFAFGLLCIWFLWSILHRHRPQDPKNISVWVYGIALMSVFLFGPNSIEWPSSLWMIYPRFGVIAAVGLFLLPRPQLTGPWGCALALSASVLVVSNARLNAHHVKRFSNWADKYDAVRKTIPKGARVLALTVTRPPDMTTNHAALGSLYFYHMVDGASYVAFMFDAAALPVRQIAKVKPRAPFWKTPFRFNPATHGVDFDYLVLRGSELIKRTDKAGFHTKMKQPNGWAVYKTKQPTPRP
jgi:hypothetical protein